VVPGALPTLEVRGHWDEEGYAGQIGPSKVHVIHALLSSALGRGLVLGRVGLHPRPGQIVPIG
jgi:hypothetical protein